MIYALQILAVAMPVTAFALFRTNNTVLSIASLFALLLICIAAYLLTLDTLKQKWRQVSSHVRTLQWVLVTCAVAGLLSSLRLFALYEQFRLPFRIDLPLQLVVSALWLAVVATLLSGFTRALIESLKRPR